MAGLDYGRNYIDNKRLRKEEETGVFLGDKSKKWVVRIKSKGRLKTIAQFRYEEKELANECYKKAMENVL